MILLKNVSWPGLSLLFLCWMVQAHAQSAPAFVPIRVISDAEIGGATSNATVLPPQGGTLNLFIDQSVGEVSQFHVDINTGLDSDYDGIKDNDTDNAFHSSFRTGGSFPTNVFPLQGETQRGIKIKVVGSDGKAGEAEFTVLFDSGFVPSNETFDVRLKSASPLAPVIIADRDVLKMGEQFTLRIENPPAGITTFAWDLQSDGQIDTETKVPYVRLEPDAPGILPVRVMFFNATGGMRSSIGGEFVVLSSGIADGTSSGTTIQELSGLPKIDVTIDGLKVKLRPAFSGEPVSFLRLEPTWEFGDDETSYLLEPEHIYKNSGSYTVKLTLSDIETKNKVAEAEANVVVRGSTAVIESKEERDGGWFASLMKPFVLLFKVVVLVLFILLLFTGAIFLFFYLQSKKENISVRDLVLKYKKKFSGGHEDILGDIGKVEVIDSEISKNDKAEPAPMKLERGVDKVMEGANGAKEAKEVKKEDDSLPPWLTGTSPRTKAKQSKASGAGVIPKKEEIKEVPPWLAEGIVQEEEKGIEPAEDIDPTVAFIKADVAESTSARSSEAGGKKPEINKDNSIPKMEGRNDVNSQVDIQHQAE